MNTNAVPIESIMDLPGLDHLPPKLQGYLVIGFVLSLILGRVIHAIRNDGGLKQIVSSIWLGTNTPVPTPPAPTNVAPGPKAGFGLLEVMIAVALTGIMVLYISGCASLAAGADPLVVRTEQAQRGAGDGLDSLLRTEAVNRPFWRTNAPAFANFCNWLRTPVAYTPPDGSLTNIPRVIAVQFNVDDLKTAYKAAKTSSNSNSLYTGLLTFEALISQSASWMTIVTNKIPNL